MEGTQKMTKVRVFGAKRQYFPLDQSAFDVVVLEYHVLFQTFDGVVVFGVLQFRKKHLKQFEIGNGICLFTLHLSAV